jgi:hypothetical protein
MIAYLITLGAGVIFAILILASLGPVHGSSWFDVDDDGVW